MPSLDWIGKKAVVAHHREVKCRLLRCDGALSAGEPDTGNLLVQGDNLLALKALLPHYAGQVKCVYIDPPYNTGNENWIYNDAVNSPEMRAWLGKVVGGEAEDLSRHDKWLCMMYPRLVLLRKLLREDGSIWVTLDDTEAQYLKIIMDEICGRPNFLATVVWQKRTSPDARVAFSDGHDTIFIYAKDINQLRNVINKTPKNARQEKQYKNPDNDHRGPWTSSDYTAQGWRPNQMYKIKTPGGKIYTPPQGVCWKNVESVYLELVRDKRIWFGKNGQGIPRRKTFLHESEGNVPWTWWPNEETGHTQESKKETKDLFGKDDVFETPKPERLIQRILQIATNPGDMVLDAFLGSGTTAAVAHKMGRRWVGVEMGDHAVTHCVPRLRKVVEGEQGGISKAVGWSGGGGFRFCRLGPAITAPGGGIDPEVRFGDLAALAWFRATGEPLPKPPARTAPASPLLGVYRRTAIYLLYNGILKDKTPRGGNVLTRETLALLPPHEGHKIVFATGCRLGADRLARENISFRLIPFALTEK